MIKVQKPKLIFDPLLGLIDVTSVIPLIDTEVFQSLGFKYQLGLSSSIYPAATHTRKQHSIGAYERTKRLVHNWLAHGFINENEARSLEVYALYHDIGHGPFSHVTEGLGKIDHDKRGLQIFEGLKEVVEKSGFDYEKIHSFFNRENPLYLAVFDKNLGMEKFDYLERDSFYTIGERPGVEYLSRHIYFIDGKIVIDEIVIDQAKAIQDFYIKMSKNVYLRKKSAVIQRLVEKMTYYLMKDGLSESDLFNLTDFGLLGRLEVSQNKIVKFHYGNFKKGIVPKITIEFKHENVHTMTDVTQKPLKIIGLEEGVFEKLVESPHLNSAELINEVEKSLAKLLQIPEEALILIPTVGKFRFNPTDINVYSREGNIRLLSQIYPNHFQAMQEYGRSHIGFRLSVLEPHRRKVNDAANQIKDYLVENFAK